MAELRGQIALVTGAGAPGGIGFAIARYLAAQGAAVIVSDRAEADVLDARAAEIVRAGGTACAAVLDVTDTAHVAAAMALAQARYGGLDILVNNAATLAGSAPFMETSPDDWQTSFAVNLLGPMRLTQAAIPLMRERGGGRVVNIGSTASLGAEPCFGAYTAMKHGLIGLTKTIAAEFGAKGILCNAVCPGYIATDMHEAANARLAAEAGEDIAATRARRYAPVALRKAGTPDDVAAAVGYLCGPAGAYVTGIALPVTGGVPPGI